MTKRIILLTQFYDPEPIYKGQNFAEKIAAGGYDVEVVTGFPNYGRGKLYDGYRIRPVTKTTINGIAVTRLALYPSHDANRLGRVLNYLSFAASAFIYLLFFARRADLIYVNHPPITVGLAAAAAQLFRRTPLVLDIHDLWPDTLPATGMINSPRILRLISLACKWVYTRSDKIIVQSNGFRTCLLERGVPDAKLNTVISWTNELDTENTNDRVPAGFPTDTSLRVLFAGNMGRAQALDSVLEAASLLSSSGKGKDVTFLLLGSGIVLDELKLKVSRDQLQNVVFLNRVPASEVGPYLEAADCLLVHLRDEPLFQITIPSKTQTYLRAGKPILIAVKGEAAELVETAGAGIAALPQNPASLAAACLKMAAMTAQQRAEMGAAGRAYYEKELSMAKGIAKFVEIFEAAQKR